MFDNFNFFQTVLWVARTRCSTRRSLWPSYCRLPRPQGVLRTPADCLKLRLESVISNLFTFCRYPSVVFCPAYCISHRLNRSGRVAWWERVGVDQIIYSKSGPVSTGIGDRLRAGKLYISTPPRSTQPGHPFVGGLNEYQRNLWSKQAHHVVY